MEREWEDEPDEVQFKYLGYQCIIMRHPEMRHLCGYIGVPLDHPWASYSSEERDDIEVHGGITYAGKRLNTKPELTGKYWLGFDCAQAYDLVPQFVEKLRPFYGGAYKNIGYVRRELEELAKQARNADDNNDDVLVLTGNPEKGFSEVK